VAQSGGLQGVTSSLSLSNPRCVLGNARVVISNISSTAAAVSCDAAAICSTVTCVSSRESCRSRIPSGSRVPAGRVEDFGVYRNAMPPVRANVSCGEAIVEHGDHRTTPASSRPEPQGQGALRVGVSAGSADIEASFSSPASCRHRSRAACGLGNATLASPFRLGRSSWADFHGPWMLVVSRRVGMAGARRSGRVLRGSSSRGRSGTRPLVR
jgi:hypothetical protein